MLTDEEIDLHVTILDSQPDWAEWKAKTAFLLRLFAQAREANRLRREKDARIYYQNIVYAFCSQLDIAAGNKPGEGVICGTIETPSTEAQEEMANMVTEFNLLRAERKLLKEIAGRFMANVEIEAELKLAALEGKP